jgi:cold-inducible RNA-binding protein
MRLYVGNLPYSATEEELNKLFSAHGTVASVTIISDKFSGKSKGFGFVEIENDEEAKKAIEATNGTDLSGRTIVVNEARPMKPRPPRDNNYGGGGGGGGRRDFRDQNRR